MVTVTDKRIAGPIKFGHISVGDTFLLGSTPYVRIEKATIGINSINAVCLSNGKHYLFSNDKDVIEVDIEVVIKNRK